MHILARREFLIKTCNLARFSILRLRVRIGRPLPPIFMAALKRLDSFAARRRA
ncbi:MAG: hypothetical protein ACHQ7N_08400 [Candidatus Methylomirabilales bacterium]